VGHLEHLELVCRTSGGVGVGLQLGSPVRDRHCPANYWIMRDDEETLREIELIPENLLLTTKAGFINTFGYGFFATGDAAAAVFSVVEQTPKELHLV
jgi:hypothetical protein